MEKQATLRQQLAAFANGNYLEADGRINTRCYNFYDWFCKDSSLKNKADRLWKNVQKFIKHNPDINLDTHYVFFKNNCPVNGPLYDDFRICDLKEGNVIWNVTAKSGHSRKAEIYFRGIGFEEPFKIADNFSGLFKKESA
jgi:hypothetical protein